MVNLVNVLVQIFRVQQAMDVIKADLVNDAADAHLADELEESWNEFRFVGNDVGCKVLDNDKKYFHEHRTEPVLVYHEQHEHLQNKSLSIN